MHGKYAIYSESILVASSDLESSDPSMGVRHGRLYAEKGYETVAHIYQEFSMLEFESSHVSDADELLRMKARMEDLKAMNHALNLRAETPDGRVMETAFVDIADYSTELDDEAREVTLWFADGDFYRKFFPYDQPAD